MPVDPRLACITTESNAWWLGKHLEAEIASGNRHDIWRCMGSRMCELSRRLCRSHATPQVTGDMDLNPDEGSYRLSATVAPVEVGALRATLGIRPLPQAVAGAVRGVMHCTGGAVDWGQSWVLLINCGIMYIYRMLVGSALAWHHKGASEAEGCQSSITCLNFWMSCT